MGKPVLASTGLVLHMKKYSHIFKYVYYRSSNLARAYEAVLDIVANYTQGSSHPVWKPELLDSAKGAVMSNLVRSQSTSSSLIWSSVSSIFSGVADPRKNIHDVAATSALTLEEVARVASVYFSAFADEADNSIISAACGIGEVNEVKASLEAKWGKEFLLVEDIEQSVFA